MRRRRPSSRPPSSNASSARRSRAIKVAGIRGSRLARAASFPTCGLRFARRSRRRAWRFLRGRQIVGTEVSHRLDGPVEPACCPSPFELSTPDVRVIAARRSAASSHRELPPSLPVLMARLARASQSPSSSDWASCLTSQEFEVSLERHGIQVECDVVVKQSRSVRS